MKLSRALFPDKQPEKAVCKDFGQCKQTPVMQTAPKVAIVQSNYIPWKGYFDLINSVDVLIIFDDMQYTRRDWRNRNKIKTPRGLAWLTIPVDTKGKYSQKIRDTRISDLNWNAKHWRTICHSYSKAQCFMRYKEYFEDLYLGCSEKSLSSINYRFLKAMCSLLGIQTKFKWSMDFCLEGDKTERLVSLCKQAGAREYVSGPTARNYLEESLFEQEGMRLKYMDYSCYPEYPQLFPPFEHAVSIIDVIFSVGGNASKYLKSF